jgi:hypothetical protein
MLNYKSKYIEKYNNEIELSTYNIGYILTIKAGLQHIYINLFTIFTNNSFIIN